LNRARQAHCLKRLNGNVEYRYGATKSSSRISPSGRPPPVASRAIAV
jgi:hypothetical protein